MCCRDFQCSVGSNGDREYVDTVAREISLYVSTLSKTKQWNSSLDYELKQKSFFYKVVSLRKHKQKSIDCVIQAPPDMVLIVEDSWARRGGIDRGHAWRHDQCNNIMAVSSFDFIKGAGAQDELV